MSAVKRSIRDKAAALSGAARVPIDVDDDSITQTNEHAGEEASSATIQSTQPTPAQTRPQPSRTFTPKTPAVPTTTTVAKPEPTAPKRERQRRMSIILSNDDAITTLDAVSRKLKDARDEQLLKGQLGATLLLMMGLRLIANLTDDELFELARECATYQ